MFQEHLVLCQMHDDCGHNLTSTFTYNHFRSGWYHFLRLLDINMDGTFQCPLCDTSPSVVIMDATAMAFRKECVQSVLGDINLDNRPDSAVIPRPGRYVYVCVWMSVDVDACLDTYMCVQLVNNRIIPLLMQYVSLYSKFADRIYINDSGLRRLIGKLCKSMPVTDFTQALQKLRTSKKYFADLLEKVTVVHSATAQASLPVHWVPFIKCCISASPVCSYVFPSGT